MAGKADAATHAAAIARIGEAVKHEAELRTHLDEIVKGAAFKGSHRSQAFLKHVVDLALHGDPADLRERSIGVALFGRPVTYDTADDAIVRVTASDVRKRLLQRYGTAGAESKFPHQSSGRIVCTGVLHHAAVRARAAASADR
jgi:hypothetical protein